MIGPEDIHPQLDLPDLWATLQDLESGNIAPRKRSALMKLLESSPAARKAYFEYFHMAAVLQMEAAKLRESKNPVLRAVSRSARIKRSEPWLAAAAVVVLALVIGGLVVHKLRQPESLIAQAPSNTQWVINGIRKEGPTDGHTVNRGDSIRVLSGTVKLELKSGSVMVMQGPSQVSFPEIRKPALQEGWLWIDTGTTDDAFEVSTRELVVRDIGTRFGVRIGDSGRSEIHLLEGGVNVISQESGIKLATLAPDGKGRAITADGTQSELPLAEDPFPLLQSLLSGRSGYETEVIAQKPSGYWKFDGALDNSFDNEVQGHRKAKSGPSLSIHPSGVNEEAHFPGFSPYNKSLYFPAGENKRTASTSVIAFLDADDGVSRRQGAMTFWIKQKEGAEGDQMLWLAGSHSVNGAPTRSLAYSTLTASGHLVFSMVNGNRDASVKSSQSIEQGRWHHIGISWDQAALNLYMDGRRVAHRSDAPALDEWVSFGNFVRFGKPTDDLLPMGIRNFHGWLDEYALWDRPLTPEEVDRQFRAARGTGSD